MEIKKGDLKKNDFSSNFMKHRWNIHRSVWKLSILNVFNHPTAATHYSGYSYKVS
jgi:hypothetical protein